MHTLWLRFALYSEWNARLRLRAAHTIMRLRRAQPRGARRDENHTGSGSALSKPLEGIKVIEVGQEIQGPFAGLLLADMGAAVIKIENRETGDLSRWLTCGLIGGPEAKNQEVSFYFTAMNRGKRSITVDLKKAGGVALIHRLAKSCDVLLTNYRPGVLDRLGLGLGAPLTGTPRNVYAQARSGGAKGAV